MVIVDTWWETHKYSNYHCDSFMVKYNIFINGKNSRVEEKNGKHSDPREINLEPGFSQRNCFSVLSFNRLN